MRNDNVSLPGGVEGLSMETRARLKVRQLVGEINA